MVVEWLGVRQHRQNFLFKFFFIRNEVSFLLMNQTEISALLTVGNRVIGSNATCNSVTQTSVVILDFFVKNEILAP